MVAQAPPLPRQYRCSKCGRLLIKGAFVGWVEAFCTRCKRHEICDPSKPEPGRRPPRD